MLRRWVFAVLLGVVAWGIGGHSGAMAADGGADGSAFTKTGVGSAPATAAPGESAAGTFLEDLLAGRSSYGGTALLPLESLKERSCATQRTRLTIQATSRPGMLLYDQDVGNDRIRLRSADGKVLHSSKINDGLVRCLGVDVASGRYILGAVSQSGAWLPMVSIFYLTEEKARRVRSVFERRGFLALASRTSPDGHYVAFIGGREVADGLYVLDTRQDTIRRVGKPPLPPPLRDRDFECDEKFDWGTCWVDSYRDIEPEVLYFAEGDVLVATYGRDSHRRRAKQRKTVEFKL